jgi:hypothetical protein
MLRFHPRIIRKLVCRSKQYGKDGADCAVAAHGWKAGYENDIA